MKKLTLFFAACALFSTTSQAQSIDKIADDAAQSLCSCVNETYSFIDKDVQDVIIQMTQMTTEEEQTALVMGLDEEIQMRMMTQAMKMQDEQVAQDFEDCTDRMGAKLDKLAKNNDEDISEEDFVRLMVKKIKSKKGCEFASFLIETGLAEDEDWEEEETKGKTNAKVNEKPSPKPNTNNGGDERYGSGGN